jgi:hypothetical protein
MVCRRWLLVNQCEVVNPEGQADGADVGCA